MLVSSPVRTHRSAAPLDNRNELDYYLVDRYLVDNRLVDICRFDWMLERRKGVSESCFMITQRWCGPECRRLTERSWPGSCEPACRSEGQAGSLAHWSSCPANWGPCWSRSAAGWRA